MNPIVDYEIKVLHIEPTNVCNASCPQCARNIDPKFNDRPRHLSVDQFKRIVSEDTIRNLERVFMCGNYGDPAAGSTTVELMEYIRSVNPEVTLGLHTNGSVRTPEWWKSIAKLFYRPWDYVVWSIDGLEDTNHLYRVNTQWNKIIENAMAYISSGGRAEWDMIVFEHNQHQVETAKELAELMGFSKFSTKISKRFSLIELEHIKPPSGYKAPEPIINGTIVCQAIRDKSIYISATGRTHPCCWLGTGRSIGIEKFENIRASWESTTPNAMCTRTCSTSKSQNNFTIQWQTNLEYVNT